MPDRPRALPLLTLQRAVLLPGSVVTAELRRTSNLRALERPRTPDSKAPARFPERCIVAPLAGSQAAPANGAAPSAAWAPAPVAPQSVGVIARIVGRLRLPGGAVRVVLHGVRRVRLEEVFERDGVFLARTAELAEPAPDGSGDEAALEQALRRIVELLVRLARIDPRYPEDLAGWVELNRRELGPLTDVLAARLPFGFEERARFLAEADPMERLALLRRDLETALARTRLGQEGDGVSRPDAPRRPLAEILRDEGGTADHPAVIERLAARIAERPLSEAAREHALQGLESLRRAAATSPEAARLRAQLEWMLELPWGGGLEPVADAEDPFADVARALNRSHFGLPEVKERVLEFLAAHRLGGGPRGTALCFHGPPGTGKSSMGRAVARALGRPFATIPVGGMTHESELVGVSYLQEGGFPGALLQQIHRFGRRDPVILLDEIDKLSLGNEGNAGGALLQLLDPDLSAEFLDRFLGVHFDLSACLFIVTANDLDAMPDAVVDRLEVIEFSGYTETEKAEIARRHLIPRAREAAGLESWQLHLTPAALHAVIHTYTEEAGVRQLQRRLAALARRAAVGVVNGGKGLWLRKADLARLLGPPTVDEGLRFVQPSIGVSTGLAWTSHGGTLLPIEALSMPGGGHMILTGSVGEVMRESVQTALSWVRSRLKSLGVSQDLFTTIDLHLHFPGGGVPKDGPSAGIAIATALVSLITKVPARHDVAMSGEMSLLGHVLPVGGLREKLLAAIRCGIPEVIVPQRSAEDLLRLPPEIRSQLTIHLVEDVREVLGLALVSPAARETRSEERTARRRASGSAATRRRGKRRPA